MLFASTLCLGGVVNAYKRQCPGVLLLSYFFLYGCNGPVALNCGCVTYNSLREGTAKSMSDISCFSYQWGKYTLHLPCSSVANGKTGELACHKWNMRGSITEFFLCSTS